MRGLAALPGDPYLVIEHLTVEQMPGARDHLLRIAAAIGVPLRGAAGEGRLMLDVRIGHTALTWDVLAEPDRLAEAISDCAELGFAGTETGAASSTTGGSESGRRDASTLLRDHGVVMACLFQFGDWIDPAAAATLVEMAGAGRRPLRSWAATC